MSENPKQELMRKRVNCFAESVASIKKNLTAIHKQNEKQAEQMQKWTDVIRGVASTEPFERMEGALGVNLCFSLLFATGCLKDL